MLGLTNIAKSLLHFLRQAISDLSLSPRSAFTSGAVIPADDL